MVFVKESKYVLFPFAALDNKGSADNIHVLQVEVPAMPLLPPLWMKS